MPHAIEKVMGSRVVLGAEKAGQKPPAPDSKDYPGYASQFTGSNVRRRKKKGGTSVSS